MNVRPATGRNRRPLGTVFHRTRTDLTKWFLAAYLMGRDKRGVSAKFLQRELEVAYQTAWTMAHKLRHGLSEDPARPLHGFLDADETFIGGPGDPPGPPAPRFSGPRRAFHRRPGRSRQSRPQHEEPQQEPGRRRRGEGAGAKEP